MTVDKFGRHISQRNTVNPTTLENSIFSNIENKMLSNFKTNVNYIENKIIEGYQDSITNVNKRLNENDSNYGNIAKKIKLLDENLSKCEKKIKEYNASEKDINEKLLKLEDNIKTIINLESEIGQIKEIIKDTSKIEELQKDLKEDIKSRFEKFANKVYERVTEEVKHFENIHDKIDKKEKSIERTLNLHIIQHKNDKNDVQQIKNQLLKLSPSENLDNEEVMKIKSEISEILSKMSELEKKIDFDSKFDKIIQSIESLKEHIKIEDKKLKDDIDKINNIMNSKIREVIFENQKERIMKLRNDIKKIDDTKDKLINNILKGRQIHEVSLGERRHIQSLSKTIRAITNKLEEELNKIEKQLNDSSGKTTHFVLNTIKDYLDNLTREIVKIDEFLKETDKDIQISKLDQWEKAYKSYVDNYFFKSFD